MKRRIVSIWGGGARGNSSFASGEGGSHGFHGNGGEPIVSNRVKRRTIENWMQIRGRGGWGGINRKPRSFMRGSGKCYCYKTKIHHGVLLDHINSQSFPNIKTSSWSFINLEIEDWYCISCYCPKTGRCLVSVSKLASPGQLQKQLNYFITQYPYQRS